MSTSVVKLTNHQKPNGFDWPEFFENGVIISATDGEKTFEIHREGQALAFHDKNEAFGDVEVLRTPEDFREAFPNGEIPEDRIEWRMNAWFELADEDGHYLGLDSFELRDMIQTVMSKFGVTVS